MYFFYPNKMNINGRLTDKIFVDALQFGLSGSYFISQVLETAQPLHFSYLETMIV